MSNNYKILSIDESGQASYNHHSKLFVLSGVLIEESFRSHLDTKIKTLFWAELVSILNNPKISLIFIIASKQKARKLRWQPKTIFHKSYFRLLELFLIQLKIRVIERKLKDQLNPSYLESLL